MCRGCNYFLSPSTHFAVRCHSTGGAGNHHFAFVLANAVKQMKEKAIRQVCMKDRGGTHIKRTGILDVPVLKVKKKIRYFLESSASKRHTTLLFTVRFR